MSRRRQWARVECYRQVVVRDHERYGADWIAEVMKPLMPKLVIPVLEDQGFGQIVYQWDGRETNVQGLPVYR